MGGVYEPWEVQRVLDRTAENINRCPAWADGQHCFIAYYEHPGLNDGDAKVMSTHGIGPAACKRCLCGTEVKRA